jgi:3-dehydroquinate dehydratase-2
MPSTVLVLNGPNLNLLGSREPEIYGHETLSDIATLCERTAEALGIAVDFRQSNSEAEMVTWVQEARKTRAGIILNAGAFTHTSVALLDALTASSLPVIEVHLSNIFRREEFRRHSYISLAARGVICGLGSQGYELALTAMARLIAGTPRVSGAKRPQSRTRTASTRKTPVRKTPVKGKRTR